MSIYLTDIDLGSRNVMR